MGFFTDLKDDLSQAVNELMPEEGAEETIQESTEEIAEEAITEEAPVAEKSEENQMDADLDAMLNKVGGMDAPTEASSYMSFTSEDRSMDYASTSNKRVTDETSVLTGSMLINGNIASEGSLDVMGSIVGNIEVLGKLNITGAVQGNSQAAEIYAEGAKITGELRSNGSIKIGQSTVIIGNVYANSAVIAGAVKGDIDVKGPVILDASAIVMGDIKSKSVQINNGAVIEGMCSQCYAEVNPTSFFDELKKMK